MASPPSGLASGSGIDMKAHRTKLAKITALVEAKVSAEGHTPERKRADPMPVSRNARRAAHNANAGEPERDVKEEQAARLEAERQKAEGKQPLS